MDYIIKIVGWAKVFFDVCFEVVTLAGFSILGAFRKDVLHCKVTITMVAGWRVTTFHQVSVCGASMSDS